MIPILMELIVDYATPDDKTITLTTSTADDFGFELAILDTPQEHASGKTPIGFNNVDELIEILLDFKTRWNSLRKDDITIKVEKHENT